MLSKRLKTIANLVDTKNVYDVGCCLLYTSDAADD